MKWLGVFLFPPAWDARSSQGYPSIKFTCTHLYTWVKRGTVRVKFLSQEHNTMTPERAQTWTAQNQVHWPWGHHALCAWHNVIEMYVQEKQSHKLKWMSLHFMVQVYVLIQSLGSFIVHILFYNSSFAAQSLRNALHNYIKNLQNRF